MPKKLIIDGGEIEVEDGITLIQACEEAGVEIPWLRRHRLIAAIIIIAAAALAAAIGVVAGPALPVQ